MVNIEKIVEKVLRRAGAYRRYEQPLLTMYKKPEQETDVRTAYNDMMLIYKALENANIQSELTVGEMNNFQVTVKQTLNPTIALYAKTRVTAVDAYFEGIGAVTIRSEAEAQAYRSAVQATLNRNVGIAHTREKAEKIFMESTDASTIEEYINTVVGHHALDMEVWTGRDEILRAIHGAYEALTKVALIARDEFGRNEHLREAAHLVLKYVDADILYGKLEPDQIAEDVARVNAGDLKIDPRIYRNKGESYVPPGPEHQAPQIANAADFMMYHPPM